MSNSDRCAEAVELALGGQWDGAHKIVQDIDSELAAWVHAVLHKIEGDMGNSQYWYRRANRAFSQEEPNGELLRIKQELGRASG